MTREQAIELLPVITAFAAGEEIQVMRSAREWVDSINPFAVIDDANYRIKPKPRKVWLNDYGKGGITVYDSRAAADSGALESRIACHAIELPPLP